MPAAVKVRPSTSEDQHVTDATQAKPKVIRVLKREQPTKPIEYTPELVRVRALGRGYYAVREVMKDPRTQLKGIVRNDIIRNPGDVFDMDTADMRTLPVPAGHARVGGEFGTIEIETASGQYELPSWVELADERGVDLSEPTGHKTEFGQRDGQVL